MDSNQTIDRYDLELFRTRARGNNADLTGDGDTNAYDVRAFLAAYLDARDTVPNCGTSNPEPPMQPTPTPEGTVPLSELLSCWQQLDSGRATNTIYVSSSEGNDTNSGDNPAAPVATLQRAFALVNPGGWILLKRGDTFAGAGQFLAIPNRDKGGLSAQQPLVVSSYGSGAMPVVAGDPAHGTILSNWRPTSSYFVIQGIHFRNVYRDPSSPAFNPASPGGSVVVLRYGSDHLTFQGNKVEFFQAAIDINSCDPRPEFAYSDQISICGNHIMNQWSVSGNGHSQGVYASCTRGLEIAGNVFHHNGWLDDAVVPESGPTMFNHHIYIGGLNDRVSIIENIMSYPSSMAIKLRADTTRAFQNGIIKDNFIVRSPIGISLGTGEVEPGPYYSNVLIEGNYFTERGDDYPGAQGIMNAFSTNPSEQVTFRANRAFNANSSFGGHAIRLVGAQTGLLVEGNHIYNYQFLGILNQASGSMTIQNNHIQQPGMELSTIHLERTLPNYNQLTGGEPSVEDFIERLKSQHYEAWNTDLTVPALREYFEAVQ